MVRPGLLTAVFTALMVVGAPATQARDFDLQISSAQVQKLGTAKVQEAGNNNAQVGDKPVIFVHGLNPFGGLGVPCNLNWDSIKNALASWGWDAGSLVDTKYYVGDSSCDQSIDHHGSHNRHKGNNRWWTFGFNHSYIDTGSHNHDTPIEHVGYHLAWYIYDHYTSQGQPIDVVAHSMGGVVIRYALTKLEQQHSDFPPELLIEDVVTLETPHDGGYLSILCGWSTQCLELFPGSSFISGLSENPQASAGTDWTTIGSYWDPLVPHDSADGMSGAAHRLTYSWPIYEHILPLWDTSLTTDAQFDLSEAGQAWQRVNNGPRSVHKIALALSSSAD